MRVQEIRFNARHSLATIDKCHLGDEVHYSRRIPFATLQHWFGQRGVLLTHLTPGRARVIQVEGRV